MKYDLVYLAVGAVLGAYVRYQITGEGFFIGSLPISVLLVNIAGSFILGASSTAVSGLGLDGRYTIFIGIGFCGSMTTMSSFAFESVNLIGVGELATAGADIVLNVGGSLGAIILGRALATVVFGLA
ncbi:MAG: CrcB family protein [Nitrososphaerota archaeon]|nr:CrcB family protein [Nitrososphaerota archaeon]MDG6966228.1 CrcB family protein [Nitrososphaerota archaeon]MDG6968442.1 CrcB family protein [Nitrososphaerota archaeon]MDG6977663.1 CrcB family protein [Nitrososphaerota archaeon]MDG7005598.1 CrcB family protein [Nitrososphaerota archaeon]